MKYYAEVLRDSFFLYILKMGKWWQQFIEMSANVHVNTQFSPFKLYVKIENEYLVSQASFLVICK